MERNIARSTNRAAQVKRARGLEQRSLGVGDSCLFRGRCKDGIDAHEQVEGGDFLAAQNLLQAFTPLFRGKLAVDEEDG